MRITPRDITIFEALQKHGPLPNHYLFEFTKDKAHDYIGLCERTRDLARASYLRPCNSINRAFDFRVFKLGDHGDEELGKLGKHNRFAKPLRGWDDHTLMTSCITANIELQAKKAGIGYVSQEEILAYKTCPDETRYAQHPLALPTSFDYTFPKGYTLHYEQPKEMDQLFALDYGTGFRYFFLEADKGRESIRRQDFDQSSILRHFLGQKSILIRGEYRRRLGILQNSTAKPTMLWVTVAEDRSHHMRDLLREIDPKGSDCYAFKAVPEFHYTIKRTAPLVPGLFTESYQRLSGEFAINKA